MVTAISVDDEPIVHTMLAEMVEESGLPVKIVATALSADDAMTAIESAHPDLLLLDIQMGKTDGLSLARKVHEQLGYSPYIIYITAYDRFDYAREALRLGASDYILKPIRQDEFVQTLKKAINTIQKSRLQETEIETIKQQLSQVLPSLLPDTDFKPQSRFSYITNYFIDYIDHKYMDNISLTEISEHLNLSPGYAGSVFKSEIGTSFRAYLRSVRVAKAKAMLSDPSLNITQIARAVGFDDINYFSQVFFEETGIRPSDYRGNGKHWAK